MSRRNQTEIYSIFGQIEGVVAQEMVDEGKANKIEQRHIPPSQMFNDKDERAQFAIIIGREMIGEFEERIHNLRA